MVSAPAGSGKTVLLRSWIGQAGLAERAAWVPVGRDERDPQRLWLAILGALRETVPGSRLVRELTAAPDLDGWAMVERLLKDLAVPMPRSSAVAAPETDFSHTRFASTGSYGVNASSVRCRTQ
jgi:LuxR family maltose regulon positive regulatory protein